MKKDFISVACIVGLLVGSSTAAAQTGDDSSANTSKPASTSSAAVDCTSILAAAATLPSGVSGANVCSSIINAVQQTTQSSASSGKSPINYTEDTPAFYAALEKTIRRLGGKQVISINTALPAVGTNKASPIITMSTIQAESAPTYTELGLGIWLDRIKAHGGSLCTKPDQHSPIALAILGFQFLADHVLPWAIKKYHAAQAYAKASKMDAIVYYTSTGAQAGRITQIDFVPRGQAVCPANPQ